MGGDLGGRGEVRRVLDGVRGGGARQQDTHRERERSSWGVDRRVLDGVGVGVD